MPLYLYDVRINDDPCQSILASNTNQAAESVSHLASYEETIFVVSRKGIVHKFKRFGLRVRRILGE